MTMNGAPLFSVPTSVDAHHVIGEQPRGRATFTQEALAGLVASRFFFRNREHFDGHALPQIQVRRAQHDAHAAAAHDRLDAVLPAITSPIAGVVGVPSNSAVLAC